MACALPAFVLLTAITASYGDTAGYGYNGHSGYNEACVPGYGNCHPHPTPVPVPVPSPVPVNRPDFVPTPAPSPVPSPSDNSETGPGATLFPPDPEFSTNRPSCALQIPPQCLFPFEYKSLTYTTCTGVDAKDTLWCSTTLNYDGHWKQCIDPCKNKWPVKAIVSSVVAGGVAVTGIGLIAAAVDHENKHPGTPFLGADWGQRRRRKTLAAKVAPVAPVAQPLVIPPNVGVGVLSVPVAVAPERLLGALRKPANVPAAAMGPLIAFVAVVSIVAAGAIYHGINRKKHKGALDQQGEKGTGYLEVSPLE